MARSRATRNPLVLFQRGFEARFERFRAVYRDLLAMALGSRTVFITCFMAFVLASFALAPMLGRNFFPSVDAGQILMHARVPVGTRVEETANQFAAIQKAIREIIPSREIATMVDNVGMPVSGINLTYNNTGVIGPQDGDIQIKLTEDHGPTEDYVAELRRQLPERFPGVTFSFLPADIISQILNFGAPSPIDIQVRTSDLADGLRACQQAAGPYPHHPGHRRRAHPAVAPGAGLRRRYRPHPRPVCRPDDARRHQLAGGQPRRQRPGRADLLAQSGQRHHLQHRDADAAVPARFARRRCRTCRSWRRRRPRCRCWAASPTSAASQGNAVVSQYDLQNMVQIYAAVQGRDLGAVAADVRKVVAELAVGASPKIRAVKVQGQVKTMESAFSGLLFGLLGAIVLIYLLIVVNFQSWSDPFVIITALPAALAGIVWMLFATNTTLSVPALTGAIMCMGVATANSVLVISFARERLAELGDATAAALDAGFVRFRPVLMTALAMIIGMTPMALGLGEGGEQNAPLGRAVIGGLIFATIATLIFVPVVFSVIHRNHGKTAKAAPAGDHGASHVV